MSDKPLVLELLEEVMNTDRKPEEVCADSPELLDELKLHIARLDRVRGELDALFPATGSALSDPTAKRQSPDDLPQIPGHEMECMLGHGGMGIVYKARHIRLNRLVAVKMMLSGIYAGPQELYRFRREAESLAELGNASIVQIYEAGDLGGMPYFTMEFVEGGTLAQKLAGVPEPPDRAAALVITLAGAVQAAHDRGIIHRDLKPANVLLTRDGTPKISDFGLARRLERGSDNTRSGVRIGTPSYMAPEQAAGASCSAGPAIDVYALGAILYELVTGRPPFRAETAAETERQVIAEEPAPPSRLNARVPRDLETICLKCLQKDPQRRFATAADLADDLGRFQRGEAITARPTSMCERARKWVRRHPARTSGIACGLIAAAALLTGGWELIAERQATAQAVAQDLAEAEEALEQSSWTNARTAMERARVRLGSGGPAELRGRLDHVCSGLALAARLDDIQTIFLATAGTGPSGGFDDDWLDREYETAFREAGLGLMDEPPERIADRIRKTGLRRAIVGALDHWAAATHADRRMNWILAVSCAADPDPGSGWRNRVRDPVPRRECSTQLQLAAFVPFDVLRIRLRRAILGKYRDTLSELARTAPLDAQSVPLHLLLAARLSLVGGDDLGLLRRLQEAHPDDFWATFKLAIALDRRHDTDAIGYYRAAVAIRPRSLAALSDLGAVLYDNGRIAEAAALQQSIILLYPESELAHFNLALSYQEQGRLSLSADQYREAIRLKPEYAGAYVQLAQVLFDLGKFNDAREEAQHGGKLMTAHHPRRNDAEAMIARCNRLLAWEGRLGGIAAGTDKPANAAEMIDFAELCARRDRPAAAVRFYAAAFASDPIRLTSVWNSRYQAACAAVRAGLGEGLDAPPDAAARQALRTRAREWLKATRDFWAARYWTVNLSERQTTRRVFSSWREDVALAAVREPAALARLGDDERRQWMAFWTHLESMSIVDSMPSLDSAQGKVARCDWKSAADKYFYLIESSSGNLTQIWFEYAAAQLLAGDWEGYRKTCARLASHYPGTAKVRAYHVARACTLAPGAVDDLEQVAKLGKVELDFYPKAHWSFTERAALHYRSGRFQEAIPLLEISLAVEKQPGNQVVNWLWLALAHQRLGHTDEARRWLDKACQWLDQFAGELPVNAETSSGLHIHNCMEAHILRREAEILVNSSPRVR